MTDADMRQALETEALQWVVRLTSGEATVADARALKEWCARSPAHVHAFAEANSLWDAAGTAAMRRPVAASIGGRAHPSRRWFLGGAIAASVAGAGYLALRPPLHLWPSPRELAADYRTHTAERREIAVGEGVTVELNTRSSLNVLADSKDRQIELISGEAAISVSAAAQAAVAVRAGGGTVHAANAQFNLRCEAGRSTVTCHRGTLSIAYAGRRIDLAEGRQLVYADGAVEAPVHVDPAVVMAWRDGQLLFRRTPLADVVSEANRYRNGRIVLMNEALGRRPVDARIPIARIDDLIALVREAYGAKVTTLPGAIVVLS
jgi:transmembrane sensor